MTKKDWASNRERIKEKMKDVKRRISNHKTRLDLGKGDVDFDGRPGNDDIKDIDYLNEPK